MTNTYMIISVIVALAMLALILYLIMTDDNYVIVSQIEWDEEEDFADEDDIEYE